VLHNILRVELGVRGRLIISDKVVRIPGEASSPFVVPENHVASFHEIFGTKNERNTSLVGEEFGHSVFVVSSITKEGARGSVVVSVVRLPNDWRRRSNNVELGEVLEG
jgi:hypothetical protein